MDALLEEMYMAQRGGSTSYAHKDIKAPETEEGPEEDAGDNPTCAASSSTPSLWRPEVKPPMDALHHAKTYNSAQNMMHQPSLSLEILRHDAIGTLTCFFLNKVNRDLGMDLRVPLFERWLFSQRPTDGTGDPILPDPRLNNEHERAGRHLLMRELIEGGASNDTAKRVIEQLNKTAVKLLCRIQRASASLNPPSVSLEARWQSLSKIYVHFDAGRGLYSLRHKSKTVTVNRRHYEKLRALHARFGGMSINRPGIDRSQGNLKHGKRERPGKSAEEESFFHLRVFLLLLRYSSLAGGTDRGGGFQGAINEEAFDVLRRHLDCRMECFASPLNCMYARYCSAFQDTDACFGSLGTFFNFRPRQGTYEANPPFSPCVIARMVDHMEDLLEATALPLGFVVVIPAWQDGKGERTREDEEKGVTREAEEERPESTRVTASKGASMSREPSKRGAKAIYKASAASWSRLRESSFCALHVLLQAQDHGYIEGGQHKTPTRFKTSFFDTSVFFLQNAAAKRKWPASERMAEELKQACASKHEAETAARRRDQGLDQRTERGARLREGCEEDGEAPEASSESNAFEGEGGRGPVECATQQGSRPPSWKRAGAPSSMLYQKDALSSSKKKRSARHEKRGSNSTAARS